MQTQNNITVQLPKNIRQIGEVSGSYKIYIEDYVMTHVKQMGKRHGESRPVVMILLGKVLYEPETFYLFINGVVEFDHILVGESQIQLDEEEWNAVHTKMNTYFPDLKMVGWSLTGQEAGCVSETALKTFHVKYFTGHQKVFLNVILEEEEERIATMEQGRFIPQKGFYVYYDKNDAMQSYMIDCLEIYKQGSTESEVRDRVPLRFREVIREKKEVAHHQRIMTYLYSASVFLLMVVFVIGITMINNYEKMNNMEAALSYITENIRQEDIQEQPDSESIALIADNIKKELEERMAAENQTAVPKPQSPETETPEAESSEPEPPEPQVQAQAEDAGTEVVEASGPAAEPYIYYVAEGDTLASISQKHYGTKSKIADICTANEIQDMNKIMVGQKIILP